MTQNSANSKESYDNTFLDKLIQLDETHNLDFKERCSSSSLVPKLIAMANQEGGNIYIGISDTKPRDFSNVELKDAESRINQSLNNCEPRPSVKYEKLQYIKNQQTNKNRSEILNIVAVHIDKSEKLIQYKGEFPFVDKGSSHKRQLKYNEIVAYERKIQDFKKDFLATLSEKSAINSHIYIHFALIPSFSTEGYFDFLSDRDVTNPMFIQTTNDNAINVSIIGPNTRFYHPLRKIAKDFRVFGTPDNYTTATSHHIVDHRTGSRIIINRNGLITGRVRFQLKSNENSLDFRDIFENLNLYERPSKNGLFSDFMIGTLLRSLSFVIYLFSTETNWSWRRQTSTVFNLQIGLCNLQNTKIKNSESHVDISREFLKDDGIIHFTRTLDLRLTDIKLQCEEENSQYNQILHNHIQQELNSLKDELIPHFHSYYGSRSSIHFLGRRNDIEKPLLTTDAAQETMKEVFWSTLERYPLFTLFSSEQRTLVPIISRSERFRENDLRIMTAKIDDNEINQKLVQKLALNKKEMLGFKLEIPAPSGYFWDELLENSVMGSGSDFFNNFANYLLTTQLEGLKKAYVDISDEVLFETVQEKSVEIDIDLLSEVSKSDKEQIFSFKTSSQINSLVSLIDKASLSLDNRFYLILGEKTKLKLPSLNDNAIDQNKFNILQELHNSSYSIPGFETSKQYLIKVGPNCQNAHLYYNLNLQLCVDFKTVVVEFYYFIHYPENSLYAFELPTAETI